MHLARRPLRTIALAVALAAAGLVGSAAPASAHNFDVYSYFSCAATRKSPLNSDHVIDHSHPIYLDSTQVWDHCFTHDIDTRCEYVAIRTASSVTGPWGAECHAIPE